MSMKLYEYLTEPPCQPDDAVVTYHKTSNFTKHWYDEALAKIPSPGQGWNPSLMPAARAAKRHGVKLSEFTSDVINATPGEIPAGRLSEIDRAYERCNLDLRESAALPEVTPGELQPIALPDPVENETESFLKALFEPDEILVLAPARYNVEKKREEPDDEKRQAKKRDEWIAIFSDKTPSDYFKNTIGIYIKVNPLQAGTTTTKNGHVIPVAGDVNVTAFRWLLVESDKNSKEEQLGAIHEAKIPYATLVDSGGKSLHALIRLDAENLADYKKQTAEVYHAVGKLVTVDTGNGHPSRYSRLPGCQRGEARQALLEVYDDVPSYRRNKEEQKVPRATAATLPPSLDVAQWHDAALIPPDPILEDAFDLGTKGMIVGPSKSRKSFFMLQLIISLAAGLPSFLSWAISKPRRVLYINLEIPAAHFQARVRRMMAALGVTTAMLGDCFHVINARGIEPSRTLHPQLVQRAMEDQIEVVAIDPIYKLISGDESKQEEIKPFLRMVDQLCNETKCAVLYCHHGQKGIAGDREAVDRSSGSGVLGRDFDWQATIAHHKTYKETGLLVCEQIARSYPPQQAYSIAWNNAGYFVRDDAEPVLLTSHNKDKSGKIEAGPTIDDAYRVSQQKGALRSNLYHAALRAVGFSDRAARNAVDELVDSGRLIKQNFGYPRCVFVGEPEAVKNHIHKLQNPELKVIA